MKSVSIGEERGRGGWGDGGVEGRYFAFFIEPGTELTFPRAVADYY